MIDFSTRSTAPELMDSLTDPPDYAACLGDLAKVNRLTRTHAPVLAWLARVSRGMASFSLLDVACGHGDLLRAIHRWAARRGIEVELEGIDLNPGSALAAAAATPPGAAISWRTGNVFDYRPDPRPDFIVSSQFTHHLDDAGVRRFLRWASENAGRAWLDVDLHRHWLAYYGFLALSRAAGWHRIVRHDGAVSVLRGFTRSELEAAAPANARIRWQLPFRYTIEASSEVADARSHLESETGQSAGRKMFLSEKENQKTFTSIERGMAAFHCVAGPASRSARFC